MNKQKILSEIKRTASANSGVPLGLDRFYQETGIREADWKGKIWARWGDAVREAGYEPNKLTEAFDPQDVLRKFAIYVRELGRIPVTAEMRLKKRSDPSFPNEKVLRTKFGGTAALQKSVIEFCMSEPGYEDVLAICQAAQATVPELDSEQEGEEADGYVYLFKSGRYYKIGKTNSTGRRAWELSIQLPERLVAVHVISTDDPAGIEAYWHRRFESKRKNGEWFDLDAGDIRAFKRRKFM